MAVENGYCTVEDIRDQLGDTSARIDLDVIERSIVAASRSIDAFCGRRFFKDATPTPRIYDPKSDDFALIGDIASKTGLIVATDAVGDGSYSSTWTIETDFLLTPPNADVSNNSAYSWWGIQAVGTKLFPVGNRRPSLKITATYGFTEIPSDVVKAAILKTTRIIRLKDAPFGLAGMGEFGAVRMARMDPEVRVLLQPLVRMSRPDW